MGTVSLKGAYYIQHVPQIRLPGPSFGGFPIDTGRKALQPQGICMCQYGGAVRLATNVFRSLNHGFLWSVTGTINRTRFLWA